jgi:hypothetical protein
VVQNSRIAVAGSERTLSSDPAISRPNGVSSKMARSKRTFTCSAGSSRYERISSTMTSRSFSISVSSRFGRTTSSPSTCIAVAAWRDGTRT